MKPQISRNEVHELLPALSSAEQDFYSMLCQAVEAARKDDAQLRKAIFEVLRARIQRQGWTRQPPVGISEMKEYLHALDAAIARIDGDTRKADNFRAAARPKFDSIESAAQSSGTDIPEAKAEPKNVSVVAQQEPTATGDVATAPLSASPAERPPPPASDPNGRNIFSVIQRAPAAVGVARAPFSVNSARRPLPNVRAPRSQSALAVVQNEPIAAGEIAPLPVFLSLAKRPMQTVGETRSNNASILIEPRPVAAWDLEPAPISFSPASRPLSPVYPGRKSFAALPVLRLTAAIILAGLSYAIVAGKVDLGGLRNAWHVLFRLEEPASVASNSIASDQPSSGLNQAADSTPVLPLPAVYGVYALSSGQLNELGPLPVSVPDQRVFMSAPVTSPSRTTLFDGKIVFIAFRRDLVTNAPERVTIRVVAKVRRALSVDAAGKPKLTSVDAQWAVRGNSYEFRVAPLKDHPDMILIRPESDDFAFPAGRYALVLKAQAYDFSIAGPITETAQCLERTEALNGAVYSECRNP